MRTDTGSPDHDRAKFHELLESFSTVMLITHALPDEGQNAGASADVEVTSRPMQIARLDDTCDLWFLTDVDTAKVYEIQREPVVHVVAQHERDRFVSLRGRASVLEDRTLIRSLWSEPYKVWFPDGPESADIRAIHVRAEEGEYWDNQGRNKVKYMLQAAKAYATGERIETDRGEQSGRVEL